jgi:hypothetical protein
VNINIIAYEICVLLGVDQDKVALLSIPIFVICFMGAVGPYFWIYMPELLRINELSYPMICLSSTQLVMRLILTIDSSLARVFLIIFPSLSLVSAGLIFRLGIETRGVIWGDSSDSLMTDESDEEGSVN